MDIVLQLAFLTLSIIVTLSFGFKLTVITISWGVLTFYYLNLFRRAILYSVWARETAILLKISLNNPSSNEDISNTERTKFHVFIAAYKAAEIITLALEKIALQEYPVEKYEVIIVTVLSEQAEEGQQTTGEVVDELIQTLNLPNFHHLSSKERRYKAGALNIAYEYVAQLGISDNDYIIVIDADSLLPANALSIIDDEIRADGNHTFIRQLASIPMANYAACGLFSKFIAMGDSIGAVGKWARNVRSQRRTDLHAGSGVIIPLRLCKYLERKYGTVWDASVITEDARLIIGQYSMLGGFQMKTKAVPCALVEAVPCDKDIWQTYKSYWSQRVRWATGGYDEFLTLLKAKRNQIFVDPMTYAEYSPTVGELILANLRRLHFLMAWISDHAWWGILSFLAPYLWLLVAYFALPHIWMAMIGFLATVFLPIIWIWWCFREFLEFSSNRKSHDFLLLYVMAFVFGLVYTLPIVFTQLLCILGGRGFFKGWNPTTVKPTLEQIS